MNSRERVLRNLKFQETDRLPYFYQGVASINAKIASIPDCKNLKVNMEIDSLDEEKVKVLNGFYGGVFGNNAIQCYNYFSTDMYYVQPRFVQAPGRYEFQLGSVHAKMHDTTGKVTITEKFPLEEAQTVDEILNYRWPNPDWYEYPISLSMGNYLKGRAVFAFGLGGIFLPAMGIRGMENIMIDMAINKNIADAIFNQISEFNLERTRRFLETNRGIIDIVGIGDDIAAQNGLMMSKTMWREMLKPYTQKLVNLCNEYGVATYYHGCGGFSDLFDDFIGMGINCVGRLQPAARGNDFKELKEKYGKRICLCGAIDAQHKVVMGNVHEVNEHVKQLLEINKGEPGFIIGPSHSFTDDTPLVNILAIYKILRHQNV